ncbi:MAG: helix-turn-helix transcriptional regulator [Marmoricola sp.]
MTASKSERLMNLTILLLVSRAYVTKDKIRQTIEDYRNATDEAFEKKFERDKDELRAMGVPIEIGSVDPYFEDEQGYRIRRDAFELPDIELEPDEVAVLGLAARVWQHAGLASATSDALVKLKAAGHEVDRELLDAVQPRLVADEPGFEAMWQATLTRTPVRFGYRRPGDAEATERHLQPWGVVTFQERWYVVGQDTDRGEPRMFRLSRVEGEVAHDGRPGAFTVPAGTDVRALSQSLVAPAEKVEATVLVRSDAARGLRRRSAVVDRDVAGPDSRTGWDRIRLPGQDPVQLAGEVAAFGDTVLVESPAELRDRVVGRLRDLAGVPE